MNASINNNKFNKRLFAPIDASSLVVFRIGFGIIMIWDVIRYWSAGWISKYYIDPQFYFKYYGFEWIQPWDGNGMYWHFAALGVLAVFISIGFMYRTSTLLFTLGFSYVFLLDQSCYLNHFYLVILFSVLLVFAPAQRCFSIDALLNPKIRSDTIPAWIVGLLRIQIEIILIYAGLVKINYDWLHLEPLSMWLAERSDLPILGTLFTQQWAVAVAAYGVIILHLVGAPLLLYKKTRIYVFCIYAAFHILNHFVFPIGIFPWFTLFATLLFFAPDWPKRFIARIRMWRGNYAVIDNKTNIQGSIHYLSRYWVYSFLGIWISIQILFPLRHWLYPGNVSWTEEGHRFSWQMKLRSKKGSAVFYVMDPATNKTTTVNPKTILTRRQTRKTLTRPDMILQFAHYLRDNWAVKHGINNPVVTVDAFASLNGRNTARLIHAAKNLAVVERNLAHADWILSLPTHKDPWFQLFL